MDYVFSRDDAAIIYINGKEVARSFEPGAVEFASAPDSYELLGDIVAVIETMQGTTLKAVRGKKAQLAEFRKKIGTAVDAGIPLLWGVHLGIFEEPGVPQEGGGHMRLIIGYNDKTGHVLYPDSWGAGHELKRMPLAEAAAITFQLHMIRPSQ